MLNANPQYQYQPMTANQTLQIKKTSGLAGRFVCSTTGTLALYDNATGDTTGPQILNATTVTAGQVLEIGALFTRGLTAVLAGGGIGTMMYN
jgi:hypothetical protein